MMKKLIYATFALMAVSCNTNNPFFEEWDTPYGIPPFDKIKECHYLPALKAGIEAHQEEIQAIIDNPEAPSFENTVVALDRSGKLLSKVEGVMLNLVESDGTKTLNAIVEEAMPLISEHSDNITMNPALFERIRTVYEDPEMLERSREDQMLVKSFYEDFKSNGIDLPEDKQVRLKEINSELSSLALTVGNNILAESNAFKEKFGFSVANYYDKMASIEDRDLRESVFKGYSLRGNNGNEFDNKANVLRTMELRIEKARILGYDTPANQILHDKMAGNSKAVDEFLAGIMKASMARAREEIADMQKLMDEDIAAGLLPAGTKIQPWDYMYYAEKVRKARFDLDETEVMQYFKMENVRKGVFDNASRLYGISFEPIEGVSLYNPECEAFKVSDQDGSLIGVIITDYYPRSSKRAGAWMTNFVEQWVNAEGENIRPVIVNVGNFNKPEGDVPALLNIDQVETMFHEFGHALHGLLSQCSYSSLSGTAVKRDFVELPSQINENWAFQPEVLATYAFHYKTGEVIPASLVEKIQAASNFNQGFTCGELCAASILDMKWHELTSVEGVDVDTFEAEAAKQMGLVDEIIPRYRSTYFNHIFGTSGYSAGYYSYLWAEVLDKDAFQAFVEEGILNSETGMRFRSCILSRGGSEEPMTLYREFRGGDPNPEYLLKGRGLK
ncbi:MAG: M3 family metallopeptidase [Bacteroidales bacterium]|nr:M3 family metallopeptidase [Candidatus Hennigimonas equi]